MGLSAVAARFEAMTTDSAASPNPGPNRVPLPFRAEIDRQSALFRAALATCDGHARVPSCPDWDADDLIAHLTEVQWFWATIVATPITEGAQIEALAEPERAPDHASLLAAFDERHRSLGDALDAAEPNGARWMWTSDEALHTVEYITRRQAHEALIHRVDAELTAGQSISDADPALAADGVDEMLVVMLGGHPQWAQFTGDGRVVRFKAADTGDEWLVELGRLGGTHPRTGEHFDEASLLPTDGGTPVAEISGPAWALDLWLWNRGGADALERTGDSGALQHIDDALAEGLN